MDVHSLIQEYKPGQIFSASEIYEKIGGEKDHLRKSIMNEVDAERITPVYRLFTNKKIKELTDNEWTEDLPKFSRKFTLEDGSVFNGADPKNIEIAFKRLE